MVSSYKYALDRPRVHRENLNRLWREQLIYGVLLAAGRGTRFGGDKLLHPLPDGTPLAVAAARNLLAVIPDSIAVVRPDQKTLTDLFAQQGMRVLECVQAQGGMGYSLSAGVAATSEASAWVVALADMPAIQPATIAIITQLLSEGVELVAPVFQGQRGHPVGFNHVFYKALTNLQGDVGARSLLENHAQRLYRVPVEDAGVILDIDTRSDLPAIGSNARVDD